MKLKLNKNEKLGVMLALSTALISGISIFINSYGVKQFDSSVFTFSKNLVVALALSAVILAFGQFNTLKSLSKKQWLSLSIIGFIGGSIPFLLFFKGMQLVTGNAAGFLHKTLFIFVALFAVIFLKEKLSWQLTLGSILLLAGTYFLVLPKWSLSFFSTGTLLVAIAVLFWAIENVYAKYAMKSLSLSGNVVAWGRMAFGSLFLFSFILLSGKWDLVVNMTSQQFQWVAITSALLLLYVLTYYNSIQLIDVSKSASILAFGLAVTTALSFAFGKGITLMQSIGLVASVAGVGLIVVFTFTAKQPITSKAHVAEDEN